jgi:hypothetical protein
VAALRRNGWPESIGISGRFRSESVAGFRRNTQLRAVIHTRGGEFAKF